MMLSTTQQTTFFLNCLLKNLTVYLLFPSLVRKKEILSLSMQILQPYYQLKNDSFVHSYLKNSFHNT